MSMKHLVKIWLLAICLSACAGNPPAWWNPGNIYSPENRQHTVAPAAASPAAQPLTQPPAEETLNLPDEDFEEMPLTPLQDEEEENDSGDSSAQSLPDLEDLLPPPSILD